MGVLGFTLCLNTNLLIIIILFFFCPPAEIIYEDLHFVAVLFAFLAAVSAILICFMWLCNKSLHLFQKKTPHKLTGISLRMQSRQRVFKSEF